MKRLLQLFLAGVFLISFTAHARVILPKGGEQWSVGSSVQLQWDATGDTVDIQLIRKGKDPIVIAENVADTGHYLWPIEELETARDYKIKVTQGAKTLTSRPFQVTAWDANKYLGAFDEEDRSKVTYPLQASVYNPSDATITVTWDDYRLFLGDKVTITVKKQGKTANVEVVRNLPNSGTFDFDKDQITACQQGGCYFVIRNNLAAKGSQKISSHTFTFGTPVTDAFTVEKPEDVTAGEELNISWTGGTDGHRVRIDLNKGGLFHQTIKESAESLELDNKYAWPVSLSVLVGDDYAIVVTALADGSSGTSDLFTIISDEGDIKVIPPGNLKVKNKRSRKGLKWKGIKADVDIDLYRDGRRFRTIKRGQKSKKLFRWTYGDIPIGENYQIRITQTDDDSVYGISALFAIAAPSLYDRQTAQLGKDCKRLGLWQKCTAEAVEQVKVLCQYYGIELGSCTRQVAEETLYKSWCEELGIPEDECTSKKIANTMLDCEKYCISDYCTAEKIQERKAKVANRIPLICRQISYSRECEIFNGDKGDRKRTVDHAPITKAEWDKWQNQVSTGIYEWYKTQDWWRNINRYCETDEAYLLRLQHFNAYVNDQFTHSILQSLE